MNKKQFEQKFSRHIGRVMNKFDNSFMKIEPVGVDEYEDMQAYTKAEMWLLCQDLIDMLGMNERNEENDSKEANRK